jgi:hypothetical protein
MTYAAKKATLLEALKRERLSVEAADILAAIEEPTKDEITALWFWPRVAACVSPELPFADFVAMPDDEALRLVDEAMKQNAHWFESPSEKN